MKKTEPNKPQITAELIAYLDRIYPDKYPDVSVMTEKAIWEDYGAMKLIRFLKHIHENQQKRPRIRIITNMCLSSPDPAPLITPAAPPPPPLTLDQSAPKQSTPTQSSQLSNRALGLRQYRSTNLGIGTNAATPTSATNSGLGISS